LVFYIFYIHKNRWREGGKRADYLPDGLFIVGAQDEDRNAALGRLRKLGLWSELSRFVAQEQSTIYLFFLLVNIFKFVFISSYGEKII
jgi:hypothetical protein